MLKYFFRHFYDFPSAGASLSRCGRLPRSALFCIFMERTELLLLPEQQASTGEIVICAVGLYFAPSPRWETKFINPASRGKSHFAYANGNPCEDENLTNIICIKKGKKKNNFSTRLQSGCFKLNLNEIKTTTHEKNSLVSKKNIAKLPT